MVIGVSYGVSHEVIVMSYCEVVNLTTISVDGCSKVMESDSEVIDLITLSITGFLMVC